MGFPFTNADFWDSLLQSHDSLAEPALISQIARKLEPNYLENNCTKSNMEWVEGYEKLFATRHQ